VEEFVPVELQARRLVPVALQAEEAAGASRGGGGGRRRVAWRLVPVALQLRRPPVWGKMRSGVGVWG
jgi:hypothetical protein